MENASPDDSLQEFNFRQLQPDDDFSDFSLGDEQLRSEEGFFKENSKDYQEQSLAQTYVIVQGECVRACFTLVCSEIAAGSVRNSAELGGVNFPHDCFPAVKIARLGVDERFANLGWRDTTVRGFLINLSIYFSRNIAKIIGCRFIVVDAKPASVALYREHGFKSSDVRSYGRNRTMFLDLKSISG